MKKLLSVFLATLMVLAVFPMVISQSVTATTNDRIAYLDSTGNDGTAVLGDRTKPFATFKAAYNALTPEGGTLMFLSVNSVLNNPDATGLNTHYGEITITSESDDVYWAMARYNSSAAAWGEYIFKLAGPVTIDIDLATKNGKSEYIYANYNPVTVTENVACYEAEWTTEGVFSSKTEVTKSNASTFKVGSTAYASLISILGGSVNRAEDFNTNVTVNGGAWRVVAGGTRFTSGTTNTMDGTFIVNFNGGFAAYLFATNWQKTQGGQSFVTITGGDINLFCMGGQDDSMSGYLDSIVVYTGGNVKEFKAYRTDGTKTLVYGNSFTTGSSASTPAFEMPKSKSSGDTTYLDGVKLYTFRTPLNVKPLSYSSENVVYLSSAGSASGSGTKADPVRYLNQAIAILSQSGGTIKLVGDYTFDTFELNEMREFNEFPHTGNIVIDGTNEGGDNYKFIGIADGTYTGTSLNFRLDSTAQSISRPYGIATYTLNGNTTFRNVAFDVKREFGIAANFNELVLDDVGCVGTTALTSIMRVYGGVYRYAAHFNYSSNYSAGYATYSANDTNITITGDDNDTTFIIFGFSRFNSGGASANYAVPGEKPVAYAGTANITVECGTVNHIYPSVVNEQTASTEEEPREEVRKDHTGAAAVINIGGIADVDALWTGGAAEGYGSIAGDLTYNIYGNCTVNNFGAIDNCDGTRYYNVNNNYLTLMKARAKYDGVKDNLVINTDLRNPVFMQKGFGIKDYGDGTYGVRASFGIESLEYFVENGDKYNIVEMGVLVKTATNENDITYIKGKDFYPTAIDAVENTENYDPATNIAKSIVYVKDADINNYKYAGEEAADTTVYFTAPITELTDEQLALQFVFVPYVVVADAVDGEHDVFYGNATTAKSYNDVLIESIND